ncbi:MAG TPA: hypothetical protein PK639_04265 [Candidatus Woesebacteria bacterium]|nr:hypothetical protein [Candidatus Woesebacteria bacterium]
MKKLVLFVAILMALVVSGCNSSVASTPVVPVQPAIVPTVELTSIPTVVPTNAPIPTLYSFDIRFSYDPKNYGEYSIDWLIKEDANGQSKDMVWKEITSESNKIKNSCSYMYFASSFDEGVFLDNHGDIWNQKPLSEECVKALEEVSGQLGLVLPNQDLGNPRVIKCKDECEVTTNELIEKAKADLIDLNTIAQKGDAFYTVQESRTRLEPNVERYPGFGDLKFDFPTKIIMEEYSTIKDMGISFDGNQICYPESIKMDGEMDIIVPESNIVCNSTYITDDPWNFRSLVEVDTNTFFTWYFEPQYTEGKMIINIIDVQVTKFEKTSKPNMDDKPILFMHRSHETTEFKNGEKVFLKDIVYQYHLVQETTNWKVWIKMTECLLVQKENGQTLYVNSSIDYPCGDSRCMGDYQISSQAGKTMFAVVDEKGVLWYFTIK